MRFYYKVPTLMIDLSKTERELWEGLDRKARWGINKAMKMRLRVEETQEKEKYYQLYSDICEVKKIKKHNIESFEGLTILYCKYGERMIGGVSLRTIEGICGLHTNASISYYHDLCPNNLLYWESIMYAKRNGFSKFDLGGYVPNAKKNSSIYGVNKFKEQWGGELTYCKIYTKNPIRMLRGIIT